MNEAVIVSAVRTAVGRGLKGTLSNTRADDLAAIVLKESVSRAGVDPNLIEDVFLGCAMPEGSQGLNFARLSSLRAGLPDSVAGVTINRFCASGLQTIAMAAQAIRSGSNDCLIAGGAESMSLVPMSGFAFSANNALVDSRPGAYIGMGHTAENVADKYNVNRADMDQFALESHQKAAAAVDAGRFKDEIVPVPVRVDKLKGTGLNKLRGAFREGGGVTAGNSSPFSDGAAAAVLMSADRARDLGLKPLARFVSFASVGVEPEIMGIGPVAAVPKALKLAGLELKDIDLFELNEAFAAQALAVVRELGIDPSKLNVNGGAIALGHPLGCTGAKLTATLLSELRRRGGRYGMVTMCVGGGQGSAGIFELLN